MQKSVIPSECGALEKAGYSVSALSKFCFFSVMFNDSYVWSFSGSTVHSRGSRANTILLSFIAMGMGGFASLAGT